MGIERLDPENRSDAWEIARLHEEHLPDSPVVQLGEAFLYRFYYRTLIQEGLVGVSFYRNGGKIRGFASYTLEPLGFMTKGIRRHPLRLAAALVAGVVRRPPRAIRQILKVVRLMGERSRPEALDRSSHLGEILTLAVDESYRRHRPSAGDSRVAVRIFEDAVSFLADHGVTKVQLLVRPETIASRFFCTSIGCDSEKIRLGPETVYRYVYTIT